MDRAPVDTPLWTPDPGQLRSNRLTKFHAHLHSTRGLSFADYGSLHAWSVRDAPAFWSALWEFCEVRGDRGARLIEHAGEMPGARFFPDATLNFTENLLRRSGPHEAILSSSESGLEPAMSWDELADAVARAAAALRRAGVQPGDRVAGIVANVPETIVAALGAAAIGAVWSSCSPDFGVSGILDRFGQIEPVVLVAVDGYRYGGRQFDCDDKISAVVRLLPSVREVVVIPLLRDARGAAELAAGMNAAIAWPDWLRVDPLPRPFAPLPFDHPLYILFSSGTTGKPKCIVHGAGGTLMQHLKEHQLHCDVRTGDRVFYFTTCGWMMWNWLVTALASNAALVLFDGSPFAQTPARLFDLADRMSVTLFGVSAKYLDAVRKSGLRPRDTHRLTRLRTITSTGSPLAPESFDFVYQNIKTDVHLASISGGTDIVSCFVGGNPSAPVWRGEIQAAGLGMDVDVFDDQGQPTAEPGELVCKSPFPSMPVGFWNDEDGSQYRAAYFSRFPGVWRHGDWIRRTSHGGFVIYGRSDATLNPGGVRIGTAEIYRQVEQLPEVLESLAVGQQWEGDERIVLFVRLAAGVTLDDALRRRIVDRIRRETSPRHVPAKIVQVADIPRTKSGKIVELAVRDVIHGRPVVNADALANPEALDHYRDLPELQT
jgi:acetoacetyl-CoA synthetase